MMLLRHLSQSLHRPDHWLYSAWLDFITKYRRNRLGLFWVWVPPAMYIWGIGLFIGALTPVSKRTFVAFVGVSFIVFRLITTVITDATSVFAGSHAYIMDGQQRLTDYILRSVARATFYFVAAVPLALIALLTSGQFTPGGIGLAFAGLVLVYVNLLVFALLFALLGARFPDLSEFMGSAIMFAFLVTPVVWYPTSAPEGTLHGAVMRANPLHHLISVVRDPLIGQPVETASWLYLAILTASGLLASLWAYGRFARRVPLWL